MPADTLSLTLTFEPLPVTTQKFDFTSPDGLQLLNIRNADCLPDGIPTLTGAASRRANGSWASRRIMSYIIIRCGTS